MNFTKAVVRGRFIKRINRFEAYVNIDGQVCLVHVPNTGRCKEILLPSAIVLLRCENGEKRKTKYDLIAAYKDNILINIDSQIPNRVVEEALKYQKIVMFEKYTNIEREKTFGNSRFDFKLSGGEKEVCYLEVKGVTLEKHGVAKFPDAPTERGRKHVLELIDVKKSKMEAAILFLIQMENIKYFTPEDDIDEKFGQVLRLAFKAGVDVLAYNCKVGENFIELMNRIEVKL